MTDALNSGTIIYGAHQTYIIDNVIGVGSFGITYRAHTVERPGDTMSITYDVAIKEFFMCDVCVRQSSGRLADSYEDSLTTKYKRNFEREARNLAKFNSSHIVRVQEIVAQNNTYYIVMEFISGQNLNDYILSQPSQRLSEEQSLCITREIAEGLSLMHKAKMRHLDMKPSNVMLDDQLHPHIIDFGLSREVDKNGVAEGRTSIGLGTHGYSPTEQHDPTNHNPQPTIDIYALGGTLFKMLTGQTPIDSRRLIWNFPNGIVDPMQQCGISSAVQKLVLHMMKPNPSERLQTMDDVIAEIKKIEAKTKPKQKTNSTDDSDDGYDEVCARLVRICVVTIIVFIFYYFVL